MGDLPGMRFLGRAFPRRNPVVWMMGISSKLIHVEFRGCRPNGIPPWKRSQGDFDGAAFIPEDLLPVPKDPEDPRPQGIGSEGSREIPPAFPGMESRENREGLSSTPGYRPLEVKIFQMERFQSKKKPKKWEVFHFSFCFSPSRPFSGREFQVDFPSVLKRDQE